MENWLLRTKSLIGKEALAVLSHASVAVLGLGGVGGACAEALCRSGIGKMILIDNDTVDITNLNRQLFATRDTAGMLKTDAARKRLHSINPECDIRCYPQFFLPENSSFLFEERPDFVIDAIDTVTAKLYLMERCFLEKIPLISSMGTGNRLDPTQFSIGDISETAGCGCNLAKVIRRELKKRNVPRQTVLYSKEFPRKLEGGFVGDAAHGRHSPASIAFVPPVAGYLMASHVVNRLIEEAESRKTE